MMVRTLNNSSSKAMNVDGSSSSVVFSHSPGSNLQSVCGLVIVVADNAASSWTNFGTLSTLSNGILIEKVVNGSASTLMTIRDNADLSLCFPENHFGSPAMSALGALLGIGGCEFTFVGRLMFRECFSITGSDLIRATVRDNLTGIVNLNIAVLLHE